MSEDSTSLMISVDVFTVLWKISSTVWDISLPFMGCFQVLLDRLSGSSGMGYDLYRNRSVGKSLLIIGKMRVSKNSHLLMMRRAVFVCVNALWMSFGLRLIPYRSQIISL